MFLGEYQHSLDPKSRIIIPSRYREELGERFVATKGLDDCIFIYPLEEWASIGAKLRTLPLTQGKARSFVRFFLAGAAELEIDKQGRTVLPLHLREYAGVDKDVAIIGVGSRIEIWAHDKWTRYNEMAGSNFEEIAESLVDIGI